MDIELSDTMLALLKFSKRIHVWDQEVTWETLRDIVLGPIYHPEMRLRDIIEIMVPLWVSINNESRFERRVDVASLILSPALTYPSQASKDDILTYEALYNKLIRHMVSDFRLTRIDWVKNFNKE